MAIAFYDSGRLLPYRHKNLSEQIQQRNADAERTRQYIGYAGGAFANMAERTGQIFGADLYSGYKGQQPQEAGAQQAGLKLKTDQQPQEYFGGTIGRDMRKAGWQKGITDQENQRRETTHRLGLLMKRVEYGNIERDYEAWSGRDKKVLRTAYNDMWEQHLDASKLGASKMDLIRQFPALYSKKAQQTLSALGQTKDPREQETLKKLLEGYVIENNTFEKYALNEGLYNPEVATRPRDDVNMLLAYLKDGVKYPGMDRIMREYNQSNKQKRDAVPTKLDSKKTFQQQGQEMLDNLFGVNPERRKEVPLPEDAKPPHELEYFGDLETEGLYDPEKLKSDDDKPWFLRSTNVIKEPDNKQKVDPKDRKEEAIAYARKQDGVLSVKAKDFDPSGNPLEGFPRFVEYSEQVIDTALEIWRGGGSVFGNDFDPYEPDRSKHTLFNKIVTEVLDGELTPETERQAKVWASDLWDKVKQQAEVYGDAIYKEFNERDINFEAQVAAERERELGPIREVKIGPDGQPMLDSLSTTFPINTFRQDLSLPTGDPQALSDNTTINLLANEDANSNGLAVEDVKHTLTAGSVDAWEIIGGDERKMAKFFKEVPMSATKKAAFMEYLKSSNPNDHLGNSRVTGKAPTDIQQRRRHAMHLDRDQTKAIVKWAYNNNLNNLQSRHMFLTDSVLEQYPALSQLLGDIAYRHGGGFMTGSAKNKFGLEERYPKLPAAIKKTIEARSNRDKMTGLQEMFDQLFKQGRYDVDKTANEKKAWPKEKVGPRFRFIKDRFQKFSGSIIYPNPFQLDTFFK